MPKGKINVQDQFLNQARREKLRVRVELLTGTEVLGVIKSFDSFCVIVEGERMMLIYKHAISHISPADRQRINLFQQH